MIVKPYIRVKPNRSYNSSFNATTSWGSASGGFYTITFTHSFSTNNFDFTLLKEDGDGTCYPAIRMITNNVIKLKKVDTNTFTVAVPSTPDGRFAGRLSLLTT